MGYEVHCLLYQIFGATLKIFTSEFDTSSITIITDGVALLLERRQVFLRLFNLSLDFLLQLKFHIVLAYAVLKSVFLAHVVIHASVPVNTTKSVVTTSLDNINECLTTFIDAEIEKRNIESTTTKVVHHDLAVFLKLTAAVIEGSSSRLIHNIKDIKTCDQTGLLRSSTLFITKISRAGDNYILNIVPLSIGIFFHSFQNERGDCNRIVCNAIKLISGSIGLTNIAFYELNDSFRFNVLLVFSYLANYRVATLLKVDCRSKQVATFVLVCYDFGHSVIIQGGDYRICCAQVNAVYFCHFSFLLNFHFILH